MLCALYKCFVHEVWHLRCRRGNPPPPGLAGHTGNLIQQWCSNLGRSPVSPAPAFPGSQPLISCAGRFPIPPAHQLPGQVGQGWPDSFQIEVLLLKKDPGGTWVLARGPATPEGGRMHLDGTCDVTLCVLLEVPNSSMVQWWKLHRKGQSTSKYQILQIIRSFMPYLLFGFGEIQIIRLAE